MHKKQSRVLAAVAIGCAIEALLVGLLVSYKPDPPLDPVDAILLLSQMPGALIIWMGPSASGGSTNGGIFAALFIFQSPFYAALVWWVFNRSNRAQADLK